MARYITLINFTEQGSKPSRIGTSASPRRGNGSIGAGGKLIDVSLTLGEFDAVAITEAPNDEVALRSAIEYGMAGNGRSRTMRAIISDETNRIVKQLG
ncbi:MAG: GYD domain-containing protein [Chloroflexota bacterium]|nr:GYD domain-containing protein [Chloroflexota bacterium]